MKKKYPDMTALFAMKEARRRKLADLPIMEKMEIAQMLQEIGRHAPGLSVSKTEKTARLRLTGLRPKKRRVA